MSGVSYFIAKDIVDLMDSKGSVDRIKNRGGGHS